MIKHWLRSLNQRVFLLNVSKLPGCVLFSSQGNLKEEIKQLQHAEHQVKNRVAELTQRKETSSVRTLTSHFFHVVLVLTLPGVCIRKSPSPKGD